MATGSGGMKSALRPLGAGLVGGGVATLLGGGLVVGGALAVVGLGLVLAGGEAAPPPPPPAPPPPAPPPPAPPPPAPPPALPPIPQPGRSVSAAAFGTAPNPGASADYARADHDHGLPALPPPPPPAPLPPAAGDVTGALTALRVAALQGTPLDAAAPQAGEVLTFAGGAWTARALPAPPPSPSLPPPAPPPPPPAPVVLPPLDFVARGEKALRVVAAGEIELKLHNGTVNLALVSGYGGLKPVVATPGSGPHEYLLVVQAADGANPSGDAYAVQLTPMRPTGTTTVFGAAVQGGAINDGNGAVRFTAALSSTADLTSGAQVLRVSVLLLRFSA